MKLLQDITFGQYVKGTSVIHRLDPRAKLLSVLILLPLIFTSHGLIPISLLGLTILIAVILSDIPVRLVLKGIRPFLWLFLFAIVFHAFFTEGEPVSMIPWISYEGVHEGSRIMAQLTLAVIFSNLLTLTTPPLELTMGIERLLSPLERIGVPVSDIAMMMLIAIEFIPILKLEAEGIVKARKGQGSDLSSGGLIERARNIPLVLAPLIHNSFRKADELAAAIVSEGCIPGAGKGSLAEKRFRASDYAALGFALSLMFLALAVR